MAKAPCFPAAVSEKQFNKEVSQDDIVDLYKHAKTTYPKAEYSDMMDGLQADTGLPREWIAKMLSKNKTIRKATDDAFFAQRQRRALISRAKIEAMYVDKPRIGQAMVKLSNTYRNLYVLWHGPVFPWTHAQSLLEVPEATFKFAKMVGRSWKYWKSETAYREGMEAMLDNPHYRQWMEAGGDIDIGKGPIGVFAGNKPTGSMRAWDAMKPTRLALMEQELFNSKGELRPLFTNPKSKSYIANEAELKEVMTKVASRWNHLTGTLSPKESRGIFGSGGGIWFAPLLTASKWHGLVGDTAKAVGMMTKGEKTPAARAFIRVTMRTQAQLFAGHAFALAANQGMLKLQQMMGGPKQSINWSDPTRSDWLSFKIAGMEIKPRGLMEAVSMIGKGAMTITGHGRRDQTFEEQMGRYGTMKFSPGAGLVKETASGADVFGRPTPWSWRKATPTAPRYTYPEYLLTHGPIFWNEGVKEFYAGLREHGVNESRASSIINGIMRHPEILAKAGEQGAIHFVGIGAHKDYYMGR